MKTNYQKKQKFNPLLSLFFVFFILFSVYCSLLIHNQFLVFNSIETKIRNSSSPSLHESRKQELTKVLERLRSNGDIKDAIADIDEQFYTLKDFINKVNNDQKFAEGDYVKSFLDKFKKF